MERRHPQPRIVPPAARRPRTSTVTWFDARLRTEVQRPGVTIHPRWGGPLGLLPAIGVPVADPARRPHEPADRA
jgi:hypothetical protein